MTLAIDNTRAMNAYGKEFLAAQEGPQYRTDSKGRKVRVFTKDNPLTFEDVRMFYLNMRAFDDEECLEHLGYNGFRTQVESGNLVKHGAFYWVTKKAATRYKLPKPVIAGVACAFAS